MEVDLGRHDVLDEAEQAPAELLDVVPELDRIEADAPAASGSGHWPWSAVTISAYLPG